MNFEMKSGRLVFFSANRLRRILENLGHEVSHQHDPVDTNPFIQIQEKLPAAGTESPCASCNCEHECQSPGTTVTKDD